MSKIDSFPGNNAPRVCCFRHEITAPQVGGQKTIDRRSEKLRTLCSAVKSAYTPMSVKDPHGGFYGEKGSSEVNNEPSKLEADEKLFGFSFSCDVSMTQ